MSKDKITGQTIYNLQVRFINNDKSKAFIYPHSVKFYEGDNCSVDIIIPDIWFEHKDPDKYVADLEAKLEQYEKFMKDNEWDSIEEMQTTLNKCEKKYFDMQQQLAEKEKEYQSFKKIADENVNYLKDRLLEETRNYNQTKTDFAIEQLLIARSRVYNFRYNESRCLNKEDSIEDCLEVLDKQINKLKHEDKGE